MNALNYLVIGNPENRRVFLFARSLKRLGYASPIIVSHEELIANPQRLTQFSGQSLVVRLDSVGENARVESALLELGYADTVDSGADIIQPKNLQTHDWQRGELLCPRQLHNGYKKYLAVLQEVLADIPHWHLLNPPKQISPLFDKSHCQQMYSVNQLAVAPRLDLPCPCHEGPQRLREEMKRLGWRSVYIKLTCGSSASGLAVYFYGKDGGERLLTTMLLKNGRIYNSLRLQTVIRREQIDQLLSFLMREGSLIEKAMAKSRLNGAYMDCRVLVVAGRASFVVVRQNRHPITNLHLGGWRGDLQSLQSRLTPEVWRHAMEQCEKVWALHGCFHLGVDLMFDPKFKGSSIIEANAFGDLLPNLQKDGYSVYEYQIAQFASLGARESIHA